MTRRGQRSRESFAKQCSLRKREYKDSFQGEVTSEVSPYLSPMAFLGRLCSAFCISLVQYSPNGEPEGTSKSFTFSSRAKTLPRFLSTSM